MKSGFTNSLAGLIATLSLCATTATAAPAHFTGSLAGIVRDNAGVPQMGATVLLFNRSERLIQRTLTNERGAFGFEALFPEIYSVRVSLASFVPAVKQAIEVQPGMQSLLYINMASLLSTVELVYASPGQGALMSDDWKWVLRSSPATRPVLRVLPGWSTSDPNAVQHTVGAIFSDTRGLVRVSGGDSQVSDLSGQADLGTAFALATSLFGRSKLQVSGNIGHTARTDVPAASFRTSYSYDGSGPEVAVTMHQVYLPTRAGAAIASGQTDGLPALRTLSIATLDRVELTDDLRLEYGMSLDSVSFLDHLNYFSPFARLSYEVGKWGTVRAAYSSGAPPAELFVREGEVESALHQDLIALSLVPQISLRDGHAKVQRTQSFEIGWEKKVGSRSFAVTGYREIVSNGALTMGGPQDLLPVGDVLPNLSSNSSTFNIGDYSRYGYSACFTQALGDNLQVFASTGRSGVFTADPTPLSSATVEDVRTKIHLSQRYWASVRATGTVPVTGTQISTGYEWIDPNAMLPGHLYLTQDNYPEVGWNIHIRQPIHNFPGLSGRLEATADFRNMLAQGYLGVATGDGRRLVLTQSPRAVRGGLAFIF